MDFALSSEQQMLVEAMRSFVEAELMPYENEVEKTDEILLLMKTRRERFEALKEAIVSMHSSEVPEVVAMAVEAGHAPYLAWLDESINRLKLDQLNQGFKSPNPRRLEPGDFRDLFGVERSTDLPKAPPRP